MAADIRLPTLGRILEGEESHRFVEVINDGPNTGGFLIFTYADAARSPEVVDNWAETIQDVEAYFEESGWAVDWLDLKN